MFWVVLIETSSDNYPDTFIRYSVAWDGMVKPPSHWVRNINLYTLTKHNKLLPNEWRCIEVLNPCYILNCYLARHECMFRTNVNTLVFHAIYTRYCWTRMNSVNCLNTSTDKAKQLNYMEQIENQWNKRQHTVVHDWKKWIAHTWRQV